MLPAAHFVHAVAPAEETVPEGQAKHDVRPAVAGWSLYVPAEHGVHAAGRSGRGYPTFAYVPMPQPMHCDDPAAGCPARKPKPQSWQEYLFDTGTVPAAHLAHDVPP
jgi:hypothetical protein